ncbi:hypothetical protein AX16_009669 [Volvariella volvacea WC 439]|nr:hypothetical protein AX16_009669 [Volvariella volvacea WC 439]
MSVEKIDSPLNRSYSHILSHATKVPGLIFLSGQTPVDEKGRVVDGGIQEHTAQCLNNLGNVLKSAGSSWEQVVKVNVYLKDMGDFSAMNEVYEKVVYQQDSTLLVQPDQTYLAGSQSKTRQDVHSGC